MRHLHFLAVVACATIGVNAALAQDIVRLPAVHCPHTAPNHLGSSCVEAITPGSTVFDTVSSSKTYPILRGQCCCEDDGCPQGRWFVSMDYLYWRATRDAMPFAGTLTPLSGTVHGLPIDSASSYTCSMKDTGYERRSGLRSNIGYQMSDLWDMGLRYTYFHTGGAMTLGDPTVDSKSILANRLDRSLADIILDTDVDDGMVNYATQRLTIDFNTYDLELRRQLCFDSKNLAVRILGGMRFADIDQSSAIRYQGLDASSNLLTADITESVDMHGAGFLVGGEAHYLLGRNLSLFARGEVALVYSNFNVSRREVQTSATDAGVRSIRDNVKSVTPVTELSLGLRWQRGHFYVAGGYDLATWFDMAQGIDAVYQDDVDGSTNSYRVERGNLNLDGFFLETGVMF